MGKRYLSEFPLTLWEYDPNHRFSDFPGWEHVYYELATKKSIPESIRLNYSDFISVMTDNILPLKFIEDFDAL